MMITNVRLITKTTTRPLTVCKNAILQRSASITGEIYPQLISAGLALETNDNGVFRKHLNPIARTKMDSIYSRALIDTVIQNVRSMRRTNAKCPPPIHGFPLPASKYTTSVQGNRVLAYLDPIEGGEIVLPLLTTEKFLDRLANARGDGWVVRKPSSQNVWYVIVPTDVDVEDPIEAPDEVFGVDYGLVRLATVAGSNESLIYDGTPAQKHRRQIARRTAALIKKGHEKKARKIRRREHAWIKAQNHQVSAQIINALRRYPHGGIVLEQLTVYHPKTDAQSRMSCGWDHCQLSKQMVYKAKLAQISIAKISGARTSRICPKCSAEQPDASKMGIFHCVHCGHTAITDVAAAQVIRQRGIDSFNAMKKKRR